MTRVLMAFNELVGHTPVYCVELCEYLLSRGFSVTVATNLARLPEYGQLERLAENPEVRFVPNAWTVGDRPVAQLRDLVSVVRQTSADIVLFPYVENALALLVANVSHPWRRIPARTVGLFIQSTNYMHRASACQTGRLGRIVERPLLALYEHRPLRPTQWRNFHEVLMGRFRVLDAALCLDEVFVARHSSRYGWLPDIVAPWSSGSGEVVAETEEWQARIHSFMGDHPGRPVIVYLGLPDARRGYEELLRLTHTVGGCFIHCGKLRDEYGMQSLPAIRDELVSDSAILELEHFYQSLDTAAVTIEAAQCIPLPYRSSHLGSSGVMFQALAAGKPVLVPDRGLMGWRVGNFGLGLTFTTGDFHDMRYKFSMLQATPPEFFADSIERFLSYFDRAQFEAAMDGVLGLPHPPVRLPREAE